MKLRDAPRGEVAIGGPMVRAACTCIILALVSVVGCDASPANIPSGDGGSNTPPVDGAVAPDGDSTAAGDAPSAPGACPAFPADNAWNKDISSLPVRKDSAAIIGGIGASDPLRADFGAMYRGVPFGIPFVVVGASQPKLPINFVRWGSESDPGPYPMPLDAPIEGGASSTGDRHVIAVDKAACKLYELFHAFPEAKGWRANSGAVFDLRSNKLRPVGWTSADAAGLPVYAGLVRYDEVAAGALKHAIRFIVKNSRRAFVLPATHWASTKTAANLPPMGIRLRLKASFDISKMSPQPRVIAQALKTYGMMLADNGGNMYISGEPHPKWNDDHLRQLRTIKTSDFDVVDTGPIRTSYR